MAIRANLALKINVKMGGLNHLVLSDNSNYGQPGLPHIRNGTTMVVGYDVNHPTGVGFSGKTIPGDKAGYSQNLPPSFVGLVASKDKNLNQWPAVAWTNPSRQEVLDSAEFQSKFKSRLDIWRKKNKALPAHIIIYRDGVSEGQYRSILNVEVKAIRDVCKAQDEVVNGRSKGQSRTCPKILFIITSKRHHTRFYNKEEDQNKNEDWNKKGDRNNQYTPNPPNGLVVDNGITVNRHWDFFLQAHHAQIGKRSQKRLDDQETDLSSQARHARSIMLFCTTNFGGINTAKTLLQSFSN